MPQKNNKITIKNVKPKQHKKMHKISGKIKGAGFPVGFFKDLSKKLNEEVRNMKFALHKNFQKENAPNTIRGTLRNFLTVQGVSLPTLYYTLVYYLLTKRNILKVYKLCDEHLEASNVEGHKVLSDVVYLQNIKNWLFEYSNIEDSLFNRVDYFTLVIFYLFLNKHKSILNTKLPNKSINIDKMITNVLQRALNIKKWLFASNMINMFYDYYTRDKPFDKLISIYEKTEDTIIDVYKEIGNWKKDVYDKRASSPVSEDIRDLERELDTWKINVFDKRAPLLQSITEELGDGMPYDTSANDEEIDKIFSEKLEEQIKKQGNTPGGGKSAYLRFKSKDGKSIRKKIYYINGKAKVRSGKKTNGHTRYISPKTFMKEI